ncbi:growth-regulated protein homolog gamma-like [Spinachia spinachia]
MDTATRCIVLLACVAVCASSTPILNCRCVKYSQAVKAVLIAHVSQLAPRSYCNRTELIVTLKDGTSRCVNPDGDFGKKLLEFYRAQRARHRNKTSTTGPKTTATSTASARASAGASARATASQ